MRSLYSLGKNGPGEPRQRQAKEFHPKPLVAANKPINSFSQNGLFHATNIATKSGSRAMNQMIRDSHINK
jgi:hypothetical protein